MGCGRCVDSEHKLWTKHTSVTTRYRYYVRRGGQSTVAAGRAWRVGGRVRSPSSGPWRHPCENPGTAGRDALRQHRSTGAVRHRRGLCVSRPGHCPTSSRCAVGDGLFAGIPVRDHRSALQWHQRMLGSDRRSTPTKSSRLATGGEPVSLHRPAAGARRRCSEHDLAGDLADRVASLTARGLEPTEIERHEGVSTYTYRDATATRPDSAARPDPTSDRLGVTKHGDTTPAIEAGSAI